MGVPVAIADHQLLCEARGVGGGYDAFRGEWQLSTEEPLFNSRPHYVRELEHNGTAHLFHCIDPRHHCPRWVIGPSPGNENGWAFCESDSAEPMSLPKWAVWDGGVWRECDIRFHAVSAIAANVDVVPTEHMPALPEADLETPQPQRRPEPMASLAGSSGGARQKPSAVCIVS